MEQSIVDYLRYIGSPAQVGLFFLALITLIKTWPIIQKNVMEARERKESRYSTRIETLEKKVEDCRAECDRDKKILLEEIHGMRRQHVQEQISLINAIIESVNAPELKTFLKMLESVQRTLVPAPAQVVNDPHDKRDEE